MRINRRLLGKVADRPIDTVVTQQNGQTPDAARNTENTASPTSVIDRIAAMLDGSTPIQSDAWIGEVPTYKKGNHRVT